MKPDESRAAPGQDRALRILAAATFIIFFQAFMVAPMIPSLARSFAVTPGEVGLIVPGYLIAYGAATLVYGLLADRFGVWRVIVYSLLAFVLLTGLTATAASVGQLLWWRVATGFGAGGVVPMALAMVGRLFAFEQRGRRLGLLFGAMAGGMAFGSTFGVLVEPWLGWRGLFVAVAVAGGALLIALMPSRALLTSMVSAPPASLRTVFAGYGRLLGTARGGRTYAYVLLNSMFHSGVFTWLGLYFERRYGLGPVGIGLALLGYGVPGFLFGPGIGRLADRYGRGRLIPAGLALAALSAGSLAFALPLPVAVVSVTLLSLGYDMTQPMFAGIVTTLHAERPGQAMGLNVFALFAGFGLGSLVFGGLFEHGFATALGLFGAIELVLALVGLWAFSAERPMSRPVQPAAQAGANRI
jgi:predicted MFS family arabinose efflux permease